jgi:hypothetical protein
MPVPATAVIQAITIAAPGNAERTRGCTSCPAQGRPLRHRRWIPSQASMLLEPRPAHAGMRYALDASGLEGRLS